MTVQKNNNIKKVSVLDANIFLRGIDLYLFNGMIYTSPRIIDEIDVNKYKNKNRNILMQIQVAIESKKLIVKSPLKKFLQEIVNKSKITGDYNALSDADKELLALTLELKENLKDKVILFTNDYSMENLCCELNIKFSPIYEKGIKAKVEWQVYCPFCKDVRDAEDLNKNCERCGLKLKRRPKKK